METIAKNVVDWLCLSIMYTKKWSCSEDLYYMKKE